MSEAELQAWVKERLRSSKRPAHVLVCETLPYNDTGKLLRRELRVPARRAVRRLRGDAMKAAVYDTNGGPEVFRYADVPEPAVRSGGLVIEVKAIGIQGGDLINRREGVLVSVPHIVGYQAAGSSARSATASRVSPWVIVSSR